MNLKRSLLALALCATTAAGARQTIGIQGGVGHTGSRGMPFRDYTALVPRLNIGICYERELGAHLHLGADLLYQQRGFARPIDLLDQHNLSRGTALADFRYNYLALPLKLGYRFGKRTYGFGNLGLVPAVLLTATTVLPDPYSNKELRLKPAGSIPRFDLGGIAEAGVGHFITPNLQIYAAAAFQQSITTFSGPRYFPGSGLRHHGWYLNLGLRYAIATGKTGASPAKR